MSNPTYTITQGLQERIDGNFTKYQADKYPAPTHQEGTTFMGTPYYGAIVFRLDGDNTPYTLIDCNYEIDEAATIVREQPAGETDKRRGSVLELSAIDDFDVSIKARLITNHNERMPTEELQAFRKKIKAGALLNVENREFNILGIKQLVIQRIRFSATEGELNTLNVNITAYSHVPEELLIDNIDDPTENE